jgi:hypothetical protein
MSAALIIDIITGGKQENRDDRNSRHFYKY